MPTDDCILALVTALLVFSDERHSNLSFLEEVHFINNDINVVCEAIILAEQRIKIETVETTKQRMEDGKQHYGRCVYPYCAGLVFVRIMMCCHLLGMMHTDLS